MNTEIRDTEIRTATTDDASIVAETLADAFFDDPLMRWAFPDDVRHRRLVTLFGFLAEHHYLRQGGCTLAPGGDGAALWAPPGCLIDGDSFYAEHGEAFLVALEGDVERLGQMGDAMREHHPHDDHWYLFAIGVPPVAHGRGIGSGLLAHTLAQVDEVAMPAYLEATSPRSRALYARFGFEVTAEVTIDGAPPIWTMWRPPR